MPLPVVQFVDRAGIIDLAWGHPDPELLPVEALRQATERVFDRYGSDALNYGYDAGPGPLIDWLCGRLADIDGHAASPEEVIITAGTSQALDQLVTLFTRPGDVILIESPSYHLAVRIFRDHPVDLVPIASDGEGVPADLLQETLHQLRRQNRRVPFFYTVPTFNNPTGISLSIERRRQLVELAAAEQLVILEDDAYRELSYDAPAPPSLWSLGEPGTVIRLGSFAKSLAPGLRSGFITADAPTISRIHGSGVLDSGGGISHFSSLVIAEFAASREYASNVEHLRAAYRERRNALISALSTELEGLASWQQPRGGYFVWLQLLGGTSATALMETAESEGTAFMPGSAFYLGGAGGDDCLRLSFSRYPPEALVEAARRLGKAVRR